MENTLIITDKYIITDIVEEVLNPFYDNHIKILISDKNIFSLRKISNKEIYLVENIEDANVIVDYFGK